MTETAPTPQIRFSPERHLVWETSGGLPPELMAIGEFFRKGTAPGLIALADHPELRKLTPQLNFWLEFADSFMRQATALADAFCISVPPLSDETLRGILEQAPPMTGGEYLDSDALSCLWNELSSFWHDQLSASNLSPRAFIQRHHPRWGDVGRIYFHIAESSKDEAHPFAFLVTYTTRLSEQARIQHRPLGLALKDSIASNNSTQLSALLKPIEAVSGASRFIHELLASKKLFQVTFLNLRQTFSLLNEFPAFEQMGIVCRVPDFWRKGRPPKAKVSVRIGAEKRRSLVGISGVLGFDVGLAVGDRELTEAEIAELLKSTEPLVRMHGKWVEIDPAKVQKLINHLRKASQLAGIEGLTFAEAMRLVSGMSSFEDEGIDPGLIESSPDWLEVKGGPAFLALLDELRSPSPELPLEDRAILDTHVRATLRPYQLAGVHWLNTVANLGLGGCLADDMGLGKTLQIIAFLCLRKYRHRAAEPSTPTLLVVPTSLIGNWRNELRKFAPGLNFRIIHRSLGENCYPSLGEALRADGQPPDLIITTYGMVNRLPDVQDYGWSCVVADEAQAIKNAETRQSRSLRKLNAPLKLALTGTPIENNLGDLWSIFDFACPGLLGSRSEFKLAIQRMESHEPPNYGPLRHLIAPYLIRRRKTDKAVIQDLPDKIEVDAFCDLTIKQAKLYQEQVAELEAHLQETGGIARKGVILSCLTKLKQICNHPSQFLKSDRYLAEDSGKFAKLREIVEVLAERQEKLLVFSQYREITDVLEHYLSEIYGRRGLLLHGAIPASERQKLVDQFQSDQGPPFMVLSLKAGGTGLNLTKAQNVLHFDRWWNPAVENQATDRAFRIGQSKNVMVHKFICRGTIEEKISELIASKQHLASSLVEGNGEVRLTEMSNDELLRMVRLDLKAVAFDPEGP
jgi:non-specific serine/threonine protein kinase